MPFAKGQSGNPKGRAPRPRELREIEELAKTMALPALMRLSAWLSCDDPRASIAAATAILNRAYGMPKQAVNLSGDLTITTTKVLDDMRERARALRNEDGPHLIEQRDAA